jgi:2,5-diamino-6-hydroxy-4-(5-phosphoribosylamino)pyrimidine 1'-reductase
MKPYVIINAAMSVDGKLDSIERRGAALSSAQDRRRVLELRAEVDAVLVGGKTLLRESPRLTVKLPELSQQRLARGLPENPAKVGIVTRAELDPRGDFVTAGPARRILFTTSQTPPDQLELLNSLGVEVFVQDGQRVDVAQALEMLAGLGLRRLMLEGGGTLIAEFIRLGLADELRVYLAPKIFGGVTAPTLVDGAGWLASAARPLRLIEARVLDETGGLLIHYEFL